MTPKPLRTFDLESLAQSIQNVHQELSLQASRAVNVSLTIRNWLIGYHIAEFELNGSDRANYGDRLLDRLAERLHGLGVSACDKRRLYQYLRFHQAYPEIVRSLTAQSQNLLPPTATAIKKVRLLTAQSSPQLIESLSYTHIELLVGLDDSLKRAFYQTECIRGQWSVRELRRQIRSLLYERSELSLDKRKLATLTEASAEKEPPALTVRDPYVFEFLGLTPREVMSETKLEDQLLDKLQNFLLELGQGFCFEARQQRIL